MVRLDYVCMYAYSVCEWHFDAWPWYVVLESFLIVCMVWIAGDLLEMDLNRHQAKYLAFTELIGQVGTSDLTAANTFMDMGLSCVEVVRFYFI